MPGVGGQRVSGDGRVEAVAEGSQLRPGQHLRRGRGRHGSPALVPREANVFRHLAPAPPHCYHDDERRVYRSQGFQALCLIRPLSQLKGGPGQGQAVRLGGPGQPLQQQGLLVPLQG